MTTTTSASAGGVTAGPPVDEQLRLRISEELGAEFKGDIIGPGHPEYGQARRVWNAMIDRHPGLILRCTSTGDVVAAVGAARRHGLFPAVKGGGHNVAGKSMSDGGRPGPGAGRRDRLVLPDVRADL